MAKKGGKENNNQSIADYLGKKFPLSTVDRQPSEHLKRSLSEFPGN
jgi:hypothetical protein